MVNAVIQDANIGQTEDFHASGVVNVHETQDETEREWEVKMDDEIRALRARCVRLEQLVQKTLEVAIRSEQVNELTVTSVLQKTFATITETLTHSLVNMRQDVQRTEQNFIIEVVDHENVLTSEDSFLVVKGENGYIYSSLATPDKVIESGMNVFDNYFNERPELFADTDRQIINIYINKGFKDGKPSNH